MQKESATTPLDREDCMDRLTRAPLARILVCVRCLPTALPARIRVLNREKILIASSDPSILLAAQRHDVLSVQVDGLDEHNHTWSVVASGIAESVSDVEPTEDLLDDAQSYGGQLVAFLASVVVGQRH